MPTKPKILFFDLRIPPSNWYFHWNTLDSFSMTMLKERQTEKCHKYQHFLPTSLVKVKMNSELQTFQVIYAKIILTFSAIIIEVWASARRSKYLNTSCYQCINQCHFWDAYSKLDKSQRKYITKYIYPVWFVWTN